MGRSGHHLGTIVALLVSCRARPSSPVPDGSLQPAVATPTKSPSVDSSTCDGRATAHDTVYKRGVDLIDPYIIVQDRPPAQSDRRAKELLAGIACLDRALELAPTNWAALWMRGKAHQALGDHAHAADS